MEPTFKSINGAISAIPPPRPDKVVRLLFHSTDDAHGVLMPSLTKTSPQVFGIPVDIDREVPAGVCRQVRADGSTRDVSL